jgi:preprotein translocase subunit SecA
MLAHPLLNRSISSAQKKVEQQNYAIRKRLLQYDDVLNLQREVIYGLRNEVLHAQTPWLILEEMVQAILEELFQDPETLALAVERIQMLFPIEVKESELKTLSYGDREKILLQKIRDAYAVKQGLEDPNSLRQLERLILLRSIDRHWQNHLTEMDDLRHTVGLRSYAQKNPLYEYKADAFTQFERLMGSIRMDVAYALFRSASSLAAFQNLLRTIQSHRPGMAEEKKVRELPRVAPQRILPPSPAVGRNDDCPCGSGKKYKKCCGSGR